VEGAVGARLTTVTGLVCILSTTMLEVVPPGLLGGLASHRSPVHHGPVRYFGAKRLGDTKRPIIAMF
jgi:hypothetical protein